jgi:hypothetical protein
VCNLKFVYIGNQLNKDVEQVAYTPARESRVESTAELPCGEKRNDRDMMNDNRTTYESDVLAAMKDDAKRRLASKNFNF